MYFISYTHTQHVLLYCMCKTLYLIRLKHVVESILMQQFFQNKVMQMAILISVTLQYSWWPKSYWKSELLCELEVHVPNFCLTAQSHLPICTFCKIWTTLWTGSSFSKYLFNSTISPAYTHVLQDIYEYRIWLSVNLSQLKANVHTLLPCRGLETEVDSLLICLPYHWW
jgi:hypothetical protein